MAYYLIVHMNLDLKYLPPARAQIELENLTEVQTAIEAAKAASKKRVQVWKAKTE